MDRYLLRGLGVVLLVAGVWVTVFALRSPAQNWTVPAATAGVANGPNVCLAHPPHGVAEPAACDDSRDRKQTLAKFAALSGGVIVTWGVVWTVRGLRIKPPGAQP